MTKPFRKRLSRIAALAGLGAALTASPAVAQADWPNLGAYRQADMPLVAAPDPQRVVFMGDSITEFWDKAKASFFADPHRVNRGISGQTTPQMLLRFRQDVIALKPRAVVILAGTNDIAGNTGPATDTEIEGNIASMAELARAHGIRVILATLVPAGRYPWAPEADPVTRIAAINGWIRDYARTEKLEVAEFFAPMATPDGALKPELGYDGVHPNGAGYAVMQDVLSPLLTGATR